MSRFRFVDMITAEMAREHRGARFVFGDNAARYGKGGQAAVMRGEPNAIGIATKALPMRGGNAFFSDDDHVAWFMVCKDLQKVAEARMEGRTIFVPAAGIGTGLAELPTRAPRLYAFIRAFFDADGDCPWPLPSPLAEGGR